MEFIQWNLWQSIIPRTSYMYCIYIHTYKYMCEFWNSWLLLGITNFDKNLIKYFAVHCGPHYTASIELYIMSISMTWVTHNVVSFILFSLLIAIGDQ